LELYFSNKTANINGKTGQLTTKCKGDRIIALKRELVPLW